MACTVARGQQVECTIRQSDVKFYWYDDQSEFSPPLPRSFLYATTITFSPNAQTGTVIVTCNTGESTSFTFRNQSGPWQFKVEPAHAVRIRILQALPPREPISSVRSADRAHQASTDLSTDPGQADAIQPVCPLADCPYYNVPAHQSAFRHNSRDRQTWLEQGPLKWITLTLRSSVKSPSSPLPAPSLAAPAVKADASTIRVASFCVLSEYEVDTPGSDRFLMADPTLLKWETRREALCRQIRALDADVICLQDLQHHRFEDLTATLGCEWRYFSATSDDGVAIGWRASRLKLLAEPHKVRLSDRTPTSPFATALHHRVALILLFQHLDTGRHVVVATTQVPQGTGNSEAREWQGLHTAQLSWAMAQAFDPSTCVVLCGNFNDGPTSQLCRYLRESGWESAYQTAGSTLYSQRRTDYIFLKGCNVVDRLQLPHDNAFISRECGSDHWPLRATISL